MVSTVHTLYISIVLGIVITRGQYYWVLGAILGIALTLSVTFPTGTPVPVTEPQSAWNSDWTGVLEVWTWTYYSREANTQIYACIT